jgi:hypothetical protein
VNEVLTISNASPPIGIPQLIVHKILRTCLRFRSYKYKFLQNVTAKDKEVCYGDLHIPTYVHKLCKMTSFHKHDSSTSIPQGDVSTEDVSLRMAVHF